MSKKLNPKKVIRGYCSLEVAIERRKKLEEQTGVKWDFYNAEGNTKFSAVARMNFAKIDEAAAQALLPHLVNRRRDFASIQADSKLDWPVVVNGAWTLIQSGRAHGEINRSGFLAAIGLK